MVTVLWTALDKFGHAVSTSLHGLPPNFTHALQICLGRFLSPFRSARLIGSGGNSPSSRFNWRKVWTRVKCNFSSAHHHGQYIGKLSINRVRKWNFTRRRRKTKKLQLYIIPAREHWPVTTHKKVWTTTFLRHNWTSRTSLESSWSRKRKYAVSAGLAKRWKNYSSFKFLPENRKISLEWALWCASRGIDNFSLSQLIIIKPYVYGKLSISWVEICNFQQDRT